jgi:hypothetical protein
MNKKSEMYTSILPSTITDGKALKGTSYVIPTLAEPIGKGTFGSVYRIYDMNRPNEDLAVKIMEKARFKR